MSTRACSPHWPLAEPAAPRTVAVALTGASGACYGVRLIECLLAAHVRVWLLISAAGRKTLEHEMGLSVPAQPARTARFFAERCGAAAEQVQAFSLRQWSAPLASGSHPPDALVVCPCTAGTLASIAAGLSEDLIDRAAAVALKERRPLILVVRETPLSTIHLENMLRLARAGAIIMPASPGFYFAPQHVAELVDFMVARVLDHLGIAHRLLPRWGA